MHGKKRFKSLVPFQDLAPAPRRFLVFVMFNLVSYQMIAGTVMVLFARYIGMPQGWVATLLGAIPLTTLLVAFTVPLVERFGPRRILLVGWTARSLIVTPVFLLPWAMERFGQSAGWYLLFASTVGFCVWRSLGVGGWFPWLHELVPAEGRGRYLTAEMSAMQVMNVLVLYLTGRLLGGSPGMGHYLFVYGIGILAGWCSVLWVRTVPGGRKLGAVSTARQGLVTYRIAWADRPFMRYTIQSALCMACTAWLIASNVMYLRDYLDYSDRSIMYLTALSALMTAFTVRSWGHFADRNGSAQAMTMSLSMVSILALAYLLLVPGASWTPWLTPIVWILGSPFVGAFWTVSHRGMLCHVKSTGRVGYTNTWIVLTSLALGTMPVLAGQAMDRFGIWGFRLCFLIAGIGGLACAMACKWIPEEGRQAPPLTNLLIRPLAPLRTMGRIVWIVTGEEERRVRRNERNHENDKG